MVVRRSSVNGAAQLFRLHRPRRRGASPKPGGRRE